MIEPKTPLLERARTLLQEGDYKPLTTQFAADVGSWLYDYRAEESALQKRVAELEALLSDCPISLLGHGAGCNMMLRQPPCNCGSANWLSRRAALLEARNDA